MSDINLWFDVDTLLSVVTLTTLELILGVDNLVFLSIIASRLPKQQQKAARQIGLTLAWMMRFFLLAFALLLTRLVTPLFSVFNVSFSGRDLLFVFGGFFLLTKATLEIHTELEPDQTQVNQAKPARFSWVIIQIALLDVIFSLDSVLTALGLTQQFWLMAFAITVAVAAMMFLSGPLSAFVQQHPSLKILALSFLILIGTVLVADGLGFYIPRGYIYAALAFSLFVEFLNTLHRKRRKN
jgi:predicted tellurium resistance membrane protein TerC